MEANYLSQSRVTRQAVSNTTGGHSPKPWGSQVSKLPRERQDKDGLGEDEERNEPGQSLNRKGSGLGTQARSQRR